MKIVVLGSTGMLGSAVGQYFIDQYGDENVFPSYRSPEVVYGVNAFFLDPFRAYFAPSLRSLGQIDWVINCLGIIKPFITRDIEESIFINSVFPWKLAQFCESINAKMIHITTDCVYQGRKGKYIETDPHDCTDVYGKTKSLGEPTNCMVLRTSIIGEELHKHASLVSWAKSQQGQEVNGFVNHLWNGITTKQYAKVCHEIIEKGLYEVGLFHVFSDIVTKEKLLRLIDKKFELGLKVKPVDASDAIDRTLSTIQGLEKQLTIPSLEEQISQI